MRAEDFIKRLSMEGHIENGQYLECHYEYTGQGRAPSGSIYYYVSPGERTEFHRIDCDEYWVYNAGETLELWVIDRTGKLDVKHCGLSENAEPTIRFAAGEIFASRLSGDASDGCLVTCITIPRFCYEGFELLEKERMLQQYPETKAFWDAD